MKSIQDQQEKFSKLYELYTNYNSHTNISAIRDKAEVYSKHFEDSLSVVPYLEGQEIKVIDIGTGGGFPALPLAIVLPQAKITAVDSVGKKIRFIDQVKEELNLENIEALACRAEELAHDEIYREQYQVAVSRAVAELRVILEYCAGFVQPEGFVICFKKQGIEDEIAAAQNAIKELNLKMIQQIDSGGNQLLVFKKIANIKPNYPRSNKEIKKNPL